jgi:diguanylate cyclase (GGDEF)-like protein
LEQSIIQQRNETLLLNQKLEKSRQALEELSNLDELTQLPNRRAAHNLFHRELQRARLHHLPLSMIFLDMDNFKQINDFHGHEYGDVVLRSFAHIVRSQVRAGDIVTRWGGDEFVVMLADSEREGAKRIAALLLSEFQARPIHLPNGTPTFIEVSIGICQVSSSQVETSSLTRIIQTADQAMYISKRSGGCQSTILDLETLD